MRVRDRRLIFAELKRAGAKPTADQAAVLAALGELMVEFPEIPEDLPDVPMRSYLGGVIEGVIEGMSKALKDGPKVTVAVWSPADLDSGAILELLR